MNISDYQLWINARIEELKTAQRNKNDIDRLNGSIWDFVLMGCLVDVISRINYNNIKSSIKRTSKLFDDRLPKYREVYYNKPKIINDVPEQIYMVMRCGLVHSLSLVPNKDYMTSKSYENHWRKGSLLLTHRGNHLQMRTRIHNGEPIDACQLDYSTMLDDMQSALDAIFQDAKQDTTLSDHIETFVRENPTLGFVLSIPQDT